MIHIFALFLVAATLLSGCGAGAPYAARTTGCQSGSALVAVGDGFLEILCGCNEAAGTTVTSTALTCTVNSGTTVVFQYVGPKLKHQILSTTTGGQTFPHSPVSDPAVTPGVRSHAFRPSVAGTYSFTDAFNSGLTGQIVAL